MADQQQGMRFSRTEELNPQMRSLLIQFYLGMARATANFANTGTTEKEFALRDTFYIMNNFWSFLRPQVRGSAQDSKKATLDEKFYGNDKSTPDGKFEDPNEAMKTLRDMMELAGASGITMDFGWEVSDYEDYGRKVV